MRDKIWIAIIVGLLLTSMPPDAFAADHDVESAIDTTQNDYGDYSAFFDGFMDEKLSELNVPGVAVVVVQDGEIVLSKGYGVADIDSQAPVISAETVYRVGSVSKLITATAVMQLVERGEVDLHSDVNQYLTAFQIPVTYEEPITLHHLLTHSAGFEDRFIGTMAQDEDDLGSIEDFLRDNMPARVAAPGEVHSYNNYGYALAGYVVEQVTGMPFEAYVEQYIFHPLGMNHSTFAQPLPPELAAQLSSGYVLSGDEVKLADFEYDRTVPAGAMSSTAEDMAAFMIAHLQSGGSEILNGPTMELMHQQQFTHHPELPGMTYGFKERYINGQRIIGHGGDIFSNAAQMVLVPADNFGFFVVYNAYSDALREDLITAFFNQYYPETEVNESLSTLDLSTSELARFAGTYRWVKYSHSTIGKAIAFLPQYNLIVKANEDGTLSLSFFGLDDGWQFAPVEPLVFRQVDGEPIEVDGLTIDPGETLVFREGQNGEISYAFISLQNVAAEKLAWYEGGDGTYGIMGTTSLIFAITFIVLLVGAGLSRLRKTTKEVHRVTKTLRWITFAISGLNVAFVAILFLTFGEQLRFGIPPAFYILLSMPLLTTLLTLMLLGGVVLNLMRGQGSILGSLAYLIVVANSGVFIWWLNTWNLLGL